MNNDEFKYLIETYSKRDKRRKTTNYQIIDNKWTNKSLGGLKMNISSCKAKGRRLVLEVKESLHTKYPTLEDMDIIVPTSSQNGMDLIFSPLASSFFPFAPEMKYQEGLGRIYGFMEQAESNISIPNPTPVVICRSNFKEPLVIMKYNDWLKLV